MIREIKEDGNSADRKQQYKQKLHGQIKYRID